MVDVLVSVAAYAKTRAWLPTVEMKSSFLAPMKLADCFGEAQVLKVGRQFAFLEAKLWGGGWKAGRACNCDLGRSVAAKRFVVRPTAALPGGFIVDPFPDIARVPNLTRRSNVHRGI